jgi:hypothetical protein
MNHLHIADIHYSSSEDLSRDKIVMLGTTLCEIYEAKLLRQFPERPCRVSFHIPTDTSDLVGYEISFWQKAHELAHEA